ncbi:AbrB/MazE/SpoVT family DNA-binding domain-containing protein [Paenibacillus tyrfis]|uniref:AbrB/MazE/SpoVT family DNA-binding domain-containing protein n=1 Tax=Paenibacillus tyrfis TaxID=1501230 RepID=UPI000B597996|nr:AbrB/MazE/SpoVT family DNA-binding domain-containing protein [Paenibacillus tyrfis]
MIRTGIVRQMDNLGRLVLPIELRRILEMEIGDSVEIFVDDAKEQVLIRKYRTEECILCSSTEQCVYFRERYVCRACLKEMAGSDMKLNRKRKPIELNTMLRLAVVMEQNPSASQKEWANMIGISQSQVSQLISFYARPPDHKILSKS